jgi:hypothetical protein
VAARTRPTERRSSGSASMAGEAAAQRRFIDDVGTTDGAAAQCQSVGDVGTTDGEASQRRLFVGASHCRWSDGPAAAQARPRRGGPTTTGCDGTEAGRSDDLMASSRCCLDAACPAAVTDERRRLKTGSGPGYVGSDDGSDWCDTHRFCVGVREPVCSSSSSVEKKHQQLLKGK